MKYNPDIHHRQSIRLKDFDYSSEGAYFITICAEKQQCIFASAIRRGDPCGHPNLYDEHEIELTELGEICENTFYDIEVRYNIFISKYVIMPNHIHFILIISNENTQSSNLSEMRRGDDPCGCPESDEDTRATARVAPTVGSIVGGYKSLVANVWLKKCKENNISMGKIWERNYYEHIIRDDQDYQIKWNYIDTNPINWDKDEYNS